MKQKNLFALSTNNNAQKYTLTKITKNFFEKKIKKRLLQNDVNS